MGHGIKYERDGSYIHLCYSGRVTLEELYASRENAIQMLADFSCRRLLVDVVDMSNNLDTLQHFEFTSSHRRILPAGVRVAVMVRDDVKDDGSFVEDIAVNRGIDLRVFYRAPEALDWLTSSS